MNSTELVESGNLLREQQIRLNGELRRLHAQLAANDALQAANADLLRQVMEHGRAVRQSVQLQDKADAALSAGNTEEAQKLLSKAAQALPDSVPPVAAPVRRPVPAPPKGRASAPAPSPAPPAQEPAQPAPSSVRVPAQPQASAPDTSGMEQRLMARLDQIDDVALPDGYRAVLEQFSPEDLEAVLKAGRWVNKRRRKSSSSPEAPKGAEVAKEAQPRKRFFRDDQFSPAQLSRARG